MLVNAQYYTLLAHKEMGSHHIEQVISDWQATHRGDSVPVLGKLKALWLPGNSHIFGNFHAACLIELLCKSNHELS